MAEQDGADGDLEPGTTVAQKYRVVRRIGRGGMGAVYEAEHNITRRHVAVKVLLGKHSEEPSTVARFLREARAAGTIAHPHAIEVLDVLTHDARPVMVMELLEGEDLGARLGRIGRMSVGEVARVMVPVLDAVGAAHSKGIVHRDLKPDNIFLATRGAQVVPKVLDFGIAKVTEQEAVERMKLTDTGMMLGTPVYMSPEQVSGRADVDARSDLWALGVILYECLAGRPPFVGQNFGQLFAAILQDDAPSLAELAPECPADVVDVVERCLSKRAKDRPDSIEPLREALAKHLDAPSTSLAPIAAVSRASSVSINETNETLDASIPRAAAISGVEETVVASTTAPATRSAPLRPTSPRWSTAVGVVGVALAVGVTGVLVNAGRAPNSPTSSRATRVENVADVAAIAPIERSPSAGLIQPIEDDHDATRGAMDDAAVASASARDAAAPTVGSVVHSITPRVRIERITPAPRLVGGTSTAAVDAGAPRSPVGLLGTM